MASCMEQLYSLVSAVWHLQRVLSKKRDPFTQLLLLLDKVINEVDSMLTDRVWDALVKALTSKECYSAINSDRKEQIVSCIAIFQTAFLYLCLSCLLPMSSRVGNKQ